MSDAINAGDVHASASTDAEAAQLREDFADLVLRVNMDMTTQKFNPRDPVSVEIAVAQAERSIDYHLKAFAHNPALQFLAPDIKQRFRQGIQAQAPR